MTHRGMDLLINLEPSPGSTTDRRRKFGRCHGSNHLSILYDHGLGVKYSFHQGLHFLVQSVQLGKKTLHVLCCHGNRSLGLCRLLFLRNRRCYERRCLEGRREGSLTCHSVEPARRTRRGSSSSSRTGWPFLRAELGNRVRPEHVWISSGSGGTGAWSC